MIDWRAVASGTVLMWVARAGWLVAGVFGWDALDGTAVVARAAAGALWLAGVAALALPSVVTLTLARTVVPAAIPAVVAVWWLGGSSTTSGGSATAPAGALAGAAVAAVAIASGEFGHAYAQASAYGHERRFPLRPPPAFLLAAVVAWLLAALGAIGGVALMADTRWLAGVPVAALGAALAVFAWPRWHRLARRWLVVVPAGLVIHDHLVLAETVMLPRAELAGIALAPVGTQAADLSGPAPGHLLEVRLHGSTTAILAGTPRRPRGAAIHLSACLVAPTRPGRALAALAG